MSISANLMKDIIHGLSEANFDTTWVNCNNIAYYTVLHCVYIFRNIVSIGQVPSPVGDNYWLTQ